MAVDTDADQASPGAGRCTGENCPTSVASGLCFSYGAVGGLRVQFGGGEGHGKTGAPDADRGVAALLSSSSMGGPRSPQNGFSGAVQSAASGEVLRAVMWLSRVLPYL